MATEVLFYEKPGCIGNMQQKALLNSLGIKLKVRDLLTTAWTTETLRPFFANKPVSQWFNASAPRVKSGEIKVEELNAQQAVALMLEEPLLICRPLMQFGELKQSGFTAGPVLQALKVPLSPKEDLQSCPMTETATPVCGEP